MGIIQAKVDLIATGMAERKVEHRVAFDPTILYIIFQIIVDAINLYEACQHKPPAAANSMRNMGTLENWHLKRLIQKQINDDDMYALVGARMFAAMADTASKVTDEEVTAMFEEVEWNI